MHPGKLRTVIAAIENGEALTSRGVLDKTGRKLSALRNDARKLKCDDHDTIIAMLNSIGK
jgi:hypothetical protein